VLLLVWRHCRRVCQVADSLFAKGTRCGGGRQAALMAPLRHPRAPLSVAV
jgi:hypothetical protein